MSQLISFSSPSSSPGVLVQQGQIPSTSFLALDSTIMTMMIPSTITLPESVTDEFSLSFVDGDGGITDRPVKTETYLPPAFFPRPLSQLPTGILFSSSPSSSSPLPSPSSMQAKTNNMTMTGTDEAIISTLTRPFLARSSSATARLERSDPLPLIMTQVEDAVIESGQPEQDTHDMVATSPTIIAGSVSLSPPPLPSKLYEEESMVVGEGNASGETMRPMGILPPIRKNTAPAILITDHSREMLRGTEALGVSFADNGMSTSWRRPGPTRSNTMWSSSSGSTATTTTSPLSLSVRNPSAYPDSLLVSPPPRFSSRSRSRLPRIREMSTGRSEYGGTRSISGARSTVSSRSEDVKIRVKIHFNDEVRGMALTPEEIEAGYEPFLNRLRTKFGAEKIEGKTIKFLDEDGSRVSLYDGDDYELAVDSVKNSFGSPKPYQLVLWLE